MRSGKLRHRVTLQEPSETLDEYGERVEGWTSYADRWCGISPLTGKELTQAQQVQPVVTHRVTMRQTDAVKPTHRILHRERYLYVESILDADERGREMTLMCREAIDA